MENEDKMVLQKSRKNKDPERGDNSIIYKESSSKDTEY